MKVSVALLAVLLLTGCFGGTDDPVDAASTDPAPIDPSASASAPPASQGSTAPAPQSPTPSATSEPAPPAAPVEVPYTWSSTLPPEACAPATPGSCVGAIAREGWFDMPALAGGPTRASLTLTWTAEPGGIAEMAFGLLRATGCEGDGCWKGEFILDVAGPSPLLLETEVPALAAGEFLVVVARAASMVPDPAFGFAHAEQDFDATGTFVVQP